MQPGTLVFPIKDGKVLLGMKRRGFGAGKWNGFGGKTKDGEEIRRAALRELEEESGLTALEENLEPVGTLSFRSAHTDKLNWDVEVFLLKIWTGEPVETEEMSPAWHDFRKLPFENMWKDDPYWLPRILAGEKLKIGKFHFDPTAEGFEQMEIEVF